ncbi:hypothetical protein QTP86_028356 [Hemibagrus guttatus]|nr:hypothetical protein QTP86_028356 [Hemibagrus guttatus]
MAVVVNPGLDRSDNEWTEEVVKRFCIEFYLLNLIHSSIVYCLSDLFSGHGEHVQARQGRIHPGRSANPSQGTHTHTLSFTHIITHYGQFRDANQPTMHVFGPGEKTGVPGGIPTCKLYTHMAEAGIKPPTLEV